MHNEEVRSGALDAIRRGGSLSAVSRSTGVSRATLRGWRDRPVRARTSDCPRCRPHSVLPTPHPAYAYLLGQYLGDGCLSRARNDVWVLRIACAEKWPGVMAECARAAQLLRPDHRVWFERKQGCSMVTASWKHWPCLFPQHGPGKKHTRPIVLEPWQQEVVERHTGEFLRGLFHSDGCRITNWTPNRVAGANRHEYPRYFFSNESADILGLCSAGLDRLGIAHRPPRANMISVARRAAVAALDIVVGPKS